MPSRFLSDDQRARYGRYAGDPNEEQLARHFHLDAADRELVRGMRGAHNRLGFAVQLGTARFLGAFLDDPAQTPPAVITAMARQLGESSAPCLDAYRDGRQRWRHALAIREHYGFRNLEEDTAAGFRLTRWLYVLCWTGDDRPGLLFDRATTWLRAHKVLLPGITTLERLISRVRYRATLRLWHRLTYALSDEQRQKLVALVTSDDATLDTLDDLRAAPKRRTPTELLRHLDRAYADTVFGLFWLLGYQFSPRLADIGDARFWRIDRTADYGPLDSLARHRVDVELTRRNWEDLLRLAGSLKLGRIHAGAIMRVLQAKDRPTTLARALAELGRIIKTLHMLGYIDSKEKRRRILTQLNRQEFRHRLARRVCHGDRGEIRKAHRQEQEEQLGALGLTLNAIALWNSTYIQAAIDQLRREGWDISEPDIARVSPLLFKHINFLGRYAFDLPQAIADGALRPLRNPNSE